MLFRQPNWLVLQPNEASMLLAMDCAVPALGGEAKTVGAPPTGAGTLATFGEPITLKVLVATAIKMVCCRCCCSSRAGGLGGSSPTDPPGGSAGPGDLPIRSRSRPGM